MRRIYIFLIFLTSLYTYGQQVSPEVIATAGDHFENNDLSLSWTLGEPVISTFTGEYILTQGFHQEMYIITAVEEINETTFDVRIFPNPTPNLVNIYFNRIEDNEYKIQLLDFKGALIKEEKLEHGTGTFQINLDDYERANYILKIFNQNQTKTFKIIKI